MQMICSDTSNLAVGQKGKRRTKHIFTPPILSLDLSTSTTHIKKQQQDERERGSKDAPKRWRVYNA